MKSVNKVVLIGNVTRDAELKKTPTGKSVCTFGLATNRTWKTPTGEKQSLAEYHNLVAWGGFADFCGKSIKKGKPLYVEGYLKTHNWDTKEGTKAHRTEVVIGDMVLLSPRATSPSGLNPDSVEDESEVTSGDSASD